MHLTISKSDNVSSSGKGRYLSFAMMFAFYQVSNALLTSMMSVYLLGLGYVHSQVSLTVACAYILSMISQPVIGYLQRRLTPGKVNVSLMAAAGVFGIFYALSHIFPVIVALYSFMFMVINCLSPFLEKLVTISGHSYGAVRIWGTIGFSAGSQLTGLIYDYISPQALYLFFACTCAACALFLYRTYRAVGGFTAEKKKRGNGYKRLLRNRAFCIYLAITALFFCATNVEHTYIPSMLVKDGMSASAAATVILCACLGEAPIILLGHRFMHRVSNKGLLFLILGASSVQFFLYAAGVPLPVKVIVTVAAKHAPAMLLIMTHIKVLSTIVSREEQTEALAMIYTVRFFVTVLSITAAGFLLDHYSYEILFRCGFFILCAGLILLCAYKIPKGPDQKIFI